MSFTVSRRTYQVGSIVVDDDGRNIRISKSHTPLESLVVEHADRADLLAALMMAEDGREDCAKPSAEAGTLWRFTWRS